MPSISIRDALFKNDPDNNWSGPCEGLTYQRAIAALHNYGHYAECLWIRRKVLELVCKNGAFYQQYDPFTGEKGNGKDGYGPMIFAFMEYLSLLWGVNFSMDEVYWSDAVGCADSEYTQKMLGKEYKAVRKAGILYARIDGKELFTLSEGLRAVTDPDGNLLRVQCIDEIGEGTVKIGKTVFTGKTEPNGIYECKGNELVRVDGVPFLLQHENH